MTLRLLRIDELPVGRWPNRLGETRPVLDEDGLRVALARIHEAAPFSAFPGLDRLLTVLGPVGIRLTIEDVRHDLEPGASIRFSGVAAVSVDATAEPTTVLNLLHDGRWGVETTSGPADPSEPHDEGVIAISGRRLTVPIAGAHPEASARMVQATWWPALRD